MSNGIKILVVEDEDCIAACLQAIFEIDGYQVATAANGNEALKALREGLTPDLILSDLCMPELDGYGFTRALRNTSGFEATPLILMSASPLDESRLEKGSWSRFVAKPFAFEQVKVTLKQLLDTPPADPSELALAACAPMSDS